MSWEHATFNDVRGYRFVTFSNGQPNWDSVNGKAINELNGAEILARLEADGWQLISTSRATRRVRGDLVRLRGSVYEYQRPAPPVPYLYRDIVCEELGQRLDFDPHNVAETQATFNRLASAIESCLGPLLKAGWEKDPCPSAIDPQLRTHLWGRWKIAAVKVRLRRPLDGTPPDDVVLVDCPR